MTGFLLPFNSSQAWFCPAVRVITPIHLIKTIWATSCQNQQNDCAPSNDSDQPGPSLIRVFAVRMKKAWVLSYHWVHSEDFDQTGRMPRLIWAFAGATLILLVLSWGGSFRVDLDFLTSNKRILTAGFMAFRLSISDFSFPIVWGLTFPWENCNLFIFFSRTLTCLPASRRLTAFKTSLTPKLSLSSRKASARKWSCLAQAAASARILASVESTKQVLHDMYQRRKKG